MAETNTYKIALWRPDGRRNCNWDDNIERKLLEVGHDDDRWVDLAENRAQWRTLVLMVSKLRGILP
jgi:hypothetical protein